MKKFKYILSIDIGTSGYISLLNSETKEILEIIAIENEEKDKGLLKLDKTKESEATNKKQADFIINTNNIVEALERHKIESNEVIALIEHLTIRPNSPSIMSMFSLADSSAIFRAIFNNLNIELNLIRPQNWKNYLNLTKEKSTSKNLIKKLIDNKKLINKSNKDKIFNNHNLIESILIGYYYMLSYQS